MPASRRSNVKGGCGRVVHKKAKNVVKGGARAAKGRSRSRSGSRSRSRARPKFRAGAKSLAPSRRGRSRARSRSRSPKRRSFRGGDNKAVYFSIGGQVQKGNAPEALKATAVGGTRLRRLSNSLLNIGKGVYGKARSAGSWAGKRAASAGSWAGKRAASVGRKAGKRAASVGRKAGKRAASVGRRAGKRAVSVGRKAMQGEYSLKRRARKGGRKVARGASVVTGSAAAGMKKLEQLLARAGKSRKRVKGDPINPRLHVMGDAEFEAYVANLESGKAAVKDHVVDENNWRVKARRAGRKTARAAATALGYTAAGLKRIEAALRRAGMTVPRNPVTTVALYNAVSNIEDID